MQTDLQNKIRPEIAEVLYKYRFRRFINSRMLPKPEKGKCKWCGEKAKRVYCGKSCRQEAYVRFGYVDGYLFERDKGVCIKCGIDCHWLKLELRKIKQIWRKYRYYSLADLARDFGPWGTDFCRRLWEADHIIPVCEGGGCCGLENYQTLCLKCHKEETAYLAKKRARAKRPIQEMLFSID
jgi:hypothetical protein